jgi:hypothetical protein
VINLFAAEASTPEDQAVTTVLRSPNAITAIAIPTTVKTVRSL